LSLSQFPVNSGEEKRGKEKREEERRGKEERKGMLSCSSRRPKADMIGLTNWRVDTPEKLLWHPGHFIAKAERLFIYGPLSLLKNTVHLTRKLPPPGLHGQSI